jgi:uncharacterized protein (TIGR02246 family)
LTKISAAESKQIEFAIRKVFEDSCAAWNRGDLDGYLACYWDSDTIIWISGGVLNRGRKAIEAAYKARFLSTPNKMGQLTLADLEIDVLTPTDAIAFGRWILEFDDQTAKGYFTVQLKKIEDNWLIIADHSSASE